ncbi:unnamed protein product [Cladocopium goreaui]|uniref:Ammonium transporter AmtB-like domain-containing protein n=1 Tax=Cladocopium goreaui TaxID=2562237 RepID=A0A9P1D1F0_9DINO|nr:unnamed protein product [Cladocopium goreaui]|mmetsp:Transcript_66954/g.146748  ORF Transcript_66954/g.146748 Transcript_66954/m.146748 type:complete len:360 (+) Transcript_66954:49-1128(+)
MQSSLCFGLIGDSSLYTKRANKKQSPVAKVLRNDYGYTNLHDKVFAGRGLQDIYRFLTGTPQAPPPRFDVLGISYFGNEHVKKPMNEPDQYRQWSKLFTVLRDKPWMRVVFFIGGFSAKYGYCRAYDENMDKIRRWVRNAGFEVVEARNEVQRWELAADDTHFSVECLDELAAFWNKLLLGHSHSFDARAKASTRSKPKRAREPTPPRSLSPSLSTNSTSYDKPWQAHYEEFDAVSSDDEWCNKRHRSDRRQPWEDQAHHQVLESYFQLVERRARQHRQQFEEEERRLASEGHPWRTKATKATKDTAQRQYHGRRHDYGYSGYGRRDRGSSWGDSPVYSKWSRGRSGPRPPSHPPWMER